LEKPAAAAAGELEHIPVNHNLYFLCWCTCFRYCTHTRTHMHTHTHMKCVNQDVEIYQLQTKPLTNCACNGPVGLLDTMDPQNSLSCEDGWK